MLIALEGCDGSGKSTLATFLSKLFDAEIIHCSTYTPNDFEFFSRILDTAKYKNIIADRWCYGQFVYQKETERPLEDKDHYADENLNRLELRMLNENAQVILVTAPNEVIEKRLSKRGEVLINELTVKEIQDRFDWLRRHSLLTWSVYNTGGEQNV